jgi:hypothetical protein
MFRAKERASLIAMGVFALGFLSAVASADVIVFQNGDHLTGTIKSAEGGKMTVTTATLGDITFDMKDVKTFSTDEPVKLQLQDGTVIDQKVDQGADGTVTTAQGGAIAPQPIPLSEVDKVNPPPVQWTGAVVINGLLARSTTNTTQLGAAVNAIRRSDTDRITASAAYNFGQQKVGGITTTNVDNWNVNGKYDLFLTKQFYANAFGRVEKDRINFLDLRVTPGIGVGYQWFDQDNLHFNTDLGGAWVYENYTTLPSPREQVSARGAYHVDTTFWDSQLTVFHNVQVFPSIQNVKNVIFIGDVGARLKLTKTMFAEAKAELDYDSQPAPGASRTATTYTLGVGWQF